MVELRQLSAGYGRTKVVSEVDLSFAPGMVTAVLGPNGSGKSTLLKSVVGLVPRMGGDILVEGRDSRAFSPAELARTVAYLPQNRRLPEMTAGRLVLHGRFPWLGYPRRYRQADYDAARQAMEQVGAGALWDAPIATLSGGTRQKIYIAMALAQNTQTILLDEPTSFLDIGHQIQVMELCRNLAAGGKAVAVVLHDLPLALEYADRIALMADGRVRAFGTPEEVLETKLLDAVFGVRVCRVQTPLGMRYVCGKE